MSAAVWRSYLALCVVGAAATPFVGGDELPGYMFLALLFATFVAIGVGLWRHRPRHKGPWFALLGFIGLTLTGDVVGAFVETRDVSGSVMPLADVFYSLAYLPLLVAVQLLIRHSSGRRDRTTMIDTAIIVISLAMLAWVFVLEPTARSAEGGIMGKIAALLYPFADVMLMALVVRMLLGGAVRNGAVRLMTAGFLLGLTGDTAAVILANYSGGDLVGRLIDACFLVAYACFGAAALHPTMPKATQPDGVPAASPWARRRALLATASLLAPVVLLAQALSGDYRAVPIIAITCIALFLLVVARMSGLVERIEAQAQRLDQIAHTDGLTRVPNRRAWDAALAQRTEAARRNGRPLHVAILDLDYFKRFNDSRGHQAGDELLRESAAAWSASLRADDILARYGGEEFAVLLDGGTTADAVLAIERLRAVTPQGQTFSAGVATLRADEQAHEILRRADEALYGAKEAGRDRVHVASETTDFADDLTPAG